MKESSESRRYFHLKPHPNFKRASTKLKGVPWYDSIYYCWFEALKMSDSYRKMCEGSAKGTRALQEIFLDFGDVNKYSFKEWWMELDENGLKRGNKLFGEPPLLLPSQNATYLELVERQDLIESGLAAAFVIDTNRTKREMYSQAYKLIKRFYENTKPSDYVRQSTARYKLSNFKRNNAGVTLESLRAFDLKKNFNLKGWQIGLIIEVDRYLRRAWERECLQQHKYLPASPSIVVPKYDFFKLLEIDLELAKEGDLRDHRRVFYDLFGDRKMDRRHSLSVVADRHIRRGIKNVAAVERIRPSQGELGFGEFPVKN